MVNFCPLVKDRFGNPNDRVVGDTDSKWPFSPWRKYMRIYSLTTHCSWGLVASTQGNHTTAGARLIGVEDYTLHREYLGGGFEYFLCSPYVGKIPILTHIFQMGGKKPPTRNIISH